MRTASTILIFGVVAAGLIFLISRSGGIPQDLEPETRNVSIVDGTQIIEIRAKGGYSPRLTRAEAGIPTVIRFTTKGSFDCSLAMRIPNLNVSRILPQTGSTDIDIGTPQAGPLLGTCSMGMYRFQVNFE